jgi:hypothetical protein
LDLLAAEDERDPGVRTLFTKGEIVKLADQTFLVAYRFRQPSLAERAYIKTIGPHNRNPEPPPGFNLNALLTSDNDLHRILINTNTLVGIDEVVPVDPVGLGAELDPITKLLTDARLKAIEEETVSDLRKLALYTLHYAANNKGLLPVITSNAGTKKVLSACLHGDLVFENPESHDPYRFNVVLSGHHLSHIEDPSGTIMFFEGAPAADGTRGVAYCNGSGRRLGSDAWERAKVYSKISD